MDKNGGQTGFVYIAWLFKLEDGSVLVDSSFRKDFNEALKGCVPGWAREYSSETKTWKVSPDYVDVATTLAQTFYHVIKRQLSPGVDAWEDLQSMKGQ